MSNHDNCVHSFTSVTVTYSSEEIFCSCLCLFVYKGLLLRLWLFYMVRNPGNTDPSNFVFKQSEERKGRHCVHRARTPLTSPAHVHGTGVPQVSDDSRVSPDRLRAAARTTPGKAFLGGGGGGLQLPHVK